MKLGMVSCHGITCCGKKWADLEARGSKREHATFECETIYTAPCYIWNYFGFVWPFYILIEFLDL